MKRLLLLTVFVSNLSAMFPTTDSGSIGSQSDNTFQSSTNDLISNWDNYFSSSNDNSSTTDTITTDTSSSTPTENK